MGWTYFNKPPGKKAVATILDEYGPEYAAKVVASSATREAVFLVVKADAKWTPEYEPDADGTARVLLVIAYKVVKDHYNFGYKSMDETMGPYGYEAPLSILAKCSPLKPLPADLPENVFSGLRSAHEYRARCRKVAAVKVFKRGLKHGAKVVLPAPLKFANGCEERSFTVSRTGRKVLFYADAGFMARLTIRNLEGATVVVTP
jgi:hypothetical protein